MQWMNLNEYDGYNNIQRLYRYKVKEVFCDDLNSLPNRNENYG